MTRGAYRRFIHAGGYQDPSYWSPEGWPVTLEVWAYCLMPNHVDLLAAELERMPGRVLRPQKPGPKPKADPG